MQTEENKTFFNKSIDPILEDIGHSHSFVIRFFKEVFRKPFHTSEFLNQCYQVGAKSLALISLTGLIVGIVFTKQSRPPLQDVGAVSWLPNLVGIAVVKAVGPMFTALICAGRIGSSIGAELSSMRVTEQIEAMEVSAINPFKYLVTTRVLATTLMVPLLVAYCSFVGLFGSYLNVHLEESYSMIKFYQNAMVNISFFDLAVTLFKSVIFGFTIGIIGTYKGYYAKNGTRGVGLAANKSVVLAMFLIFIEEILIVQFANWFQHY